MADGGLTTAEGGGLLAIGAAIGGFLFKVWEVWIKARPSKKDLMTAAGELARDLMEGMREDLDMLRGELRELRKSHAECEERCTALTGEVRQLQAFKLSVEQLNAKLRSPSATSRGGEIEGAIIELNDGEVLMTPRDTLKKRRE